MQYRSLTGRRSYRALPRLRSFTTFTLLLLGGLGSSCIQRSAGDCPVGSAGCDCTDGGGCDEGLYCAPASQLCYADESTPNPPEQDGSAGSSNDPQKPVTKPDPTREEGPDVECAFSDLDGVATLIEELGNPLNQANGVSVSWWLPLTFGTKGGILKVGETSCTPAALNETSNATCAEGYDCGGCPMLWERWDEADGESFQLRPQDWQLDECADLAGFYGVYPGADEPVHACDIEYPEGCLCADETPVSIHKGAVSQDGIFCGAADEEDPRDKAGTHDWCTHRYACGAGPDTCESWVSIQIDRKTGEKTFSLGSNCPLNAKGDVYEAASCPDYAAEASACSACIEACSGVPECYCTSECGSSSYSCAQ